MTDKSDNRKDNIRIDSKKDKHRANLLLASILGAIAVIVAGVSIIFWRGATLVQ